MSWQYDRSMVSHQFTCPIEKLGMSQAGAGRFLDISARQVSRMAKGEALIRPPTSCCSGPCSTTATYPSFPYG
jgi:hypothetical protein